MISSPEHPFTPTANAPLYQQIYTHLQAAILAGRLPGGMKLPSTRTLANELRLSRNTVVTAYDQLLAEGYIESGEGSGTYVARVLPDQLLTLSTPRPPASRPPPPVAQPPLLSAHAQAQLTSPTPSLPKSTRPGHIRQCWMSASRKPRPMWRCLMRRAQRAPEHLTCGS